MNEYAAAGTTVFIDDEEAIVGSKGPFHPVYADPEGTDPWGYYCTACDAVDNAMDTMGRIVCNECRNTRRPEEWDAAHE